MVWEPLEYNTKPMERYIREALNIKKALDTEGVILMNANTEFTKCVLPGITPAPTEQEKQEDEDIRNLIRNLKRNREKMKKSRTHTTATAETVAAPPASEGGSLVLAQWSACCF